MNDTKSNVFHLFGKEINYSLISFGNRREAKLCADILASQDHNADHFTYQVVHTKGLYEVVMGIKSETPQELKKILRINFETIASFQIAFCKGFYAGWKIGTTK